MKLYFEFRRSEVKVTGLENWSMRFALYKCLTCFILQTERNPFSALTLLVGLHPTCKKSYTKNPQRFVFGRSLG